MRINDAAVYVTNGVIRANTAVSVSDSRLDLAGVSIVGEKSGIDVELRSQVVLSLCDVKSNQYEGFGHGAFRISNKSIDSMLSSAK